MKKLVTTMLVVALSLFLMGGTAFAASAEDLNINGAVDHEEMKAHKECVILGVQEDWYGQGLCDGLTRANGQPYTNLTKMRCANLLCTVHAHDLDMTDQLARNCDGDCVLKASIIQEIDDVGAVSHTYMIAAMSVDRNSPHKIKGTFTEKTKLGWMVRLIDKEIFKSEIDQFKVYKKMFLSDAKQLSAFKAKELGAAEAVSDVWNMDAFKEVHMDLFGLDITEAIGTLDDGRKYLKQIKYDEIIAPKKEKVDFVASAAKEAFAQYMVDAPESKLVLEDGIEAPLTKSDLTYAYAKTDAVATVTASKDLNPAAEVETGASIGRIEYAFDGGVTKVMTADLHIADTEILATFTKEDNTCLVQLDTRDSPIDGTRILDFWDLGRDCIEVPIEGTDETDEECTDHNPVVKQRFESEVKACCAMFNDGVSCEETLNDQINTRLQKELGYAVDREWATIEAAQQARYDSGVEYTLGDLIETDLGMTYPTFKTSLGDYTSPAEPLALVNFAVFLGEAVNSLFMEEKTANNGEIFQPPSDLGQAAWDGAMEITQNHDDDGDGVHNIQDNCPDVPNPKVDTDGNGNPDTQPDADGDGYGDACDNCVDVPNGVQEDDQADSDGDGIGDACEGGGGTCYDENGNPTPCCYDSNNNEVPCCYDSNGNQAPCGTQCLTAMGGPCPAGVTDCADEYGNPCVCTDVNGQSCESTCFDENGGPCLVGATNCTNVHGVACNPYGWCDTGDADSDGAGIDANCDGVFESTDNCPIHYNPDQADSDNDGVGDICAGLDSDSDGLNDAVDNCPYFFNPMQADFDGDGIGDWCDSDFVDPDADGVDSSVDNCPNVFNYDQIDRDGDGIGQKCDVAPANCLDPNGGVCDIPDDTYCENEYGLSCWSEGWCEGGDADSDGVLNDGSCDGSMSNLPCTGGQTWACDDNCPNTPNSDQLDTDGDGYGDVCDNAADDPSVH